MSNIIIILLFISALLISLTIHELGHFTFAKIFKVRVLEFAIGIGPKLFGFKHKNSQYNFRLLLVGAYVQMDSLKLRKLYDEINNEEKQEEWFRESIAKLSWLEYLNCMFSKEDTWFYWKNYFKYNSYRKRYAKSHLAEDKFFMYDEIGNWKKTLICIAGVLFNLILVAICILIVYLLPGYGINSIWESVVQFYKNLWNIIIWTKPEGADSQGGITGVPLGILFLNLVMSINFSLLLLNILPIPPLDGFKILTIGYNSIFKKDINEKVEVVFQSVGMLLMFYITIASVIQQFIW